MLISPVPPSCLLKLVSFDVVILCELLCFILVLYYFIALWTTQSGLGSQMRGIKVEWMNKWMNQCTTYLENPIKVAMWVPIQQDIQNTYILSLWGFGNTTEICSLNYTHFSSHWKTCSLIYHPVITEVDPGCGDNFGSAGAHLDSPLLAQPLHSIKRV